MLYTFFLYFIFGNNLNPPSSEFNICLPLDTKHEAYLSEIISDRNNNEYLWRYVKEFNQLEVYEVETGQLLHSKIVESTGPNGVNRFFALKPISEEEVYIIDLTGELVKYHMTKGVLTKRNIIKGLPEIHSLIVKSSGALRDIFIYSDELYLPISPRNPPFYQNKNDFKFYIKHNLLTGENLLLEANFPKSYFKNGLRGFNYHSAYDGKGNLVILPNDYSEAYAIDLKSSKLSKIEINLLKNGKFKKWEGVTQADKKIIQDFYTYAVNVGLVYDKYRNLYYRFLWPGANEYKYENKVKFEQIRNYYVPFFQIEIYDKDFNLKKVEVMPDFVYNTGHFVISKQGLCLMANHPENPDNEEDVVTFHVYDFSK